MLAQVNAGALVGIDAFFIRVEIDVQVGLPAIVMVGLPDSAVKESAARVKSAISNAG